MRKTLILLLTSFFGIFGLFQLAAAGNLHIRLNDKDANCFALGSQVGNLLQNGVPIVFNSNRLTTKQTLITLPVNIAGNSVKIPLIWEKLTDYYIQYHSYNNQVIRTPVHIRTKSGILTLHVLQMFFLQKTPTSPFRIGIVLVNYGKNWRTLCSIKTNNA